MVSSRVSQWWFEPIGAPHRAALGADGLRSTSAVMTCFEAMVTSSSRGQRCVVADNSWLLAGYGGLAGYFAFEALTREPGDASSLKASNDDRGTTRLIVGAFVAATLLPLASLRIRAVTLPRAAGPAGLVLQAGGITLRVWSMRTLGDSYTRTLRTRERQPLVEAGPYRVVRHPGYAGSLLSWTGFALTSRSLPVVAAVTALLGRVYRQRIVAEEALLRRELPGYSAYSHRTRRLIPVVW